MARRQNKTPAASNPSDCQMTTTINYNISHILRLRINQKKRDAATATSLHFSITLILISRMSLLVSGRTSDKPEDAIPGSYKSPFAAHAHKHQRSQKVCFHWHP